jgi:hypothetical protein
MAASLPIVTFHALDDQLSVISFPPRSLVITFDDGYHPCLGLHLAKGYAT